MPEFFLSRKVAKLLGSELRSIPYICHMRWPLVKIWKGETADTTQQEVHHSASYRLKRVEFTDSKFCRLKFHRPCLWVQNFVSSSSFIERTASFEDKHKLRRLFSSEYNSCIRGRRYFAEQLDEIYLFVLRQVKWAESEQGRAIEG
jgi:hypothetical protein